MLLRCCAAAGARLARNALTPSALTGTDGQVAACLLRLVGQQELAGRALPSLPRQRFYSSGLDVQKEVGKRCHTRTLGAQNPRTATGVCKRASMLQCKFGATQFALYREGHHTHLAEYRSA